MATHRSEADTISGTGHAGKKTTHAREDVGGPSNADFGPAAALRADHDALEKRAATVLDSIEAGGRSEISEAIALMRTSILAHLDGEERDVLPGYASNAPDDACRIMEEHAAIRKTLDELDIATDLHFLRANVVKELLAKLRAHAARENTGLYRFAMTR